MKGLGDCVKYAHKDDFFDVVHISGHADIKDGKPIFLLENDFSEVEEADADAIASVFSTHGRYPRLLFLSGCKTAQNSEKALPSLAEALVKAGVPAVLGWAKSVGDSFAILSAEKLYQLLADGVDLVRAVALTRQALWQYEQTKLEKNPIYQPQWHYLRFYSNLTPSMALVVPDAASTYHEIELEFLDDERKVRVCPRENFVGRRRLIQNALRLLRKKQSDSSYVEGVQLLGIGGLGKSSLALRLCQRLEDILPNRFICQGRVDETEFFNILLKKGLIENNDSKVDNILRDEKTLELRLISFFKKFKELNSTLFVFDDFEQNFIDNNHKKCQPDAYAVINALAKTIRHTGSSSRILITSRGQIELEKPFCIAPLDLDSFRDADLDKKIRALRSQHLSEEQQKKISDSEKRAIELGAGNPRLLERLYQVLANTALPHEQILESLATKQTEFREELLLETLLSYQTVETRNLIARVALFEIFVPKEVLQAVFPENLDACLQAARAVGLIESYQGRFFVSRLLLSLLDGELDAEEIKTTYRLAAQCLYALWWESEYQISEKETTELSRISHVQRGNEPAIFSRVADALASRLHDVSRYNEAKALYADLLPVRREIKDRRGEGETLNNLATAALSQGDYATALRYLQDSLKIQQEIGDKQGEGATLNNISQIYKVKGDYATALGYLQDSLKITQEIGDKKGEGVTLNNLAINAHTQGDYATALRYLQDSLKIMQEIGDKQGEGTTLNNISQIYKVKGDYATALRYLQDSLKIQQEIGDKQGESVTLNNLSRIANVKGDYKLALQYLEQDLKILRKIGDKKGEATTLNNFATTALSQGDYTTALRYLQDSLKIQQEIGDMAGMCPTLFNMGHVHWQNEEKKEAFAKWVEAYQIAKKIGLAQALDALDSMAKQLGGDGLAFWEQFTE